MKQSSLINTLTNRGRANSWPLNLNEVQIINDCSGFMIYEMQSAFFSVFSEKKGEGRFIMTLFIWNGADLWPVHLNELAQCPFDRLNEVERIYKCYTG